MDFESEKAMVYTKDKKKEMTKKMKIEKSKVGDLLYLQNKITLNDLMAAVEHY